MARSLWSFTEGRPGLGLPGRQAGTSGWPGGMARRSTPQHGALLSTGDQCLGEGALHRWHIRWILKASCCRKMFSLPCHEVISVVGAALSNRRCCLLCAGWGEEEREHKRAALRRVLDAAVAGNTDGLFYYQGLHDIAAVLLFVCGELPAYRLLRDLAAGHLRDCTRPDLAAATETLRLLYPILQQVGEVKRTGKEGRRQRLRHLPM